MSRPDRRPPQFPILALARSAVGKGLDPFQAVGTYALALWCGARSAAQLAELLSLSESTCKRRLRALRKALNGSALPPSEVPHLACMDGLAVMAKGGSALSPPGGQPLAPGGQPLALCAHPLAPLPSQERGIQNPEGAEAGSPPPSARLPREAYTAAAGQLTRRGCSAEERKRALGRIGRLYAESKEPIRCPRAWAAARALEEAVRVHEERERAAKPVARDGPRYDGPACPLCGHPTTSEGWCPSPRCQGFGRKVSHLPQTP